MKEGIGIILAIRHAVSALSSAITIGVDSPLGAVIMRLLESASSRKGKCMIRPQEALPRSAREAGSWVLCSGAAEEPFPRSFPLSKGKRMLYHVNLNERMISRGLPEKAYSTLMTIHFTKITIPSLVRD
jgi:hypothetical protein